MANSFPKLLNGGGKAGEFIRSYDWSSSALGNPDCWPQSLLIILNMMLNSSFPMILFWGEEHNCFYNDASIPVIPGSHLSVNESIGKNGASIWKESWKDIKPFIDMIWMGGESVQSENSLLATSHNGTPQNAHWVLNYNAVKNESAVISGVLVLCNENTDKMQDLQMLQLSNTRFHDLVRNASVGIIVLTGKEMKVEIVNKFYGLLIDRTPEDLLNKPLFDIIPEAAEPFMPILEKVRTTGEPLYLYDHPYQVLINGKQREGFINIIYQPLKETDGTISGVIALCQDVTLQVNSRKQLEESENRFRSLIEEVSIPMCLYMGDDMKIQIINEALLTVWGKDKSVIGKTLKEVLPEMEDQPFLDLLHKVYDTKIPVSLKNAESVLNKNGISRTIYFDLWYKPMIDKKSGNVYGILASGVDVTEKVLLQRQTEESEMRFKMMVNHATVAIGLTKGKEMVFENINAPMLQLIDRTIDVIGKPLLKVLPELKGQLIETILNNVLSTGESYNGNEIPAMLMIEGKPEHRFYNISYIPLAENGITTYIVHIAIDVTLQVTTRQQIEEATAKTNLAIESASLGTYEINLLTEEMMVSERFTAIWGADHRVMPRAEFVSFIHHEDRELRKRAHEESIRSGKLYYEARVVWKDESIHWVRINGKVLYDKNGKAVTLIGMIQDITEQKIVQQRKDNFIAMASHELKTPLTSIKAYAQMIGEILVEKDAPEESLMMKKMDAQLNKLGKLVEDLLNMSKIDMGKLAYERTSFNFNDYVSQLAEEMQLTTSQHTLHLKLSGPVNVCADQNRIGQVVTNLISNAIKYSPHSDVINITTHISGGEVVVSIQDFGIGISETEQEMIFSQFYRVNNARHQSFPGMGIGLYICATIIKKEGGKIWVKSAEDKGSTFYFSLPVEA